jgi:hypothetical protein
LATEKTVESAKIGGITMPRTGKYCKAYPAENFREFSSWTESLENLRKERKEVDGKEVEIQRTLREKDHFYLHEDFTVTDGIFMDQNIIFNNITDEWVTFCKETLKFEVPVYELKTKSDKASQEQV